MTSLPLMTITCQAKGGAVTGTARVCVAATSGSNPSPSGPPRFSALCLRGATKSKAKVTMGLQVGMPSSVSPFARPMTAMMRAPGYPLTEVVTQVVIVGNRFISDMERVPFPEGAPLMVLHDPPGGGSHSELSNARTKVKYTKAGKTVQGGYAGESDAKAGADVKLGQSSLCAGFGAMACVQLAEGAKIKAMAAVSLGASRQSEKGGMTVGGTGSVAEYSKLDEDIEVEFTYSTSPDGAGPSRPPSPPSCRFFPVSWRLLERNSGVWSAHARC